MRHSDARVEIDSVTLPWHLFFQSGFLLLPQVYPVRSIVPVSHHTGAAAFSQPCHPSRQHNWANTMETCIPKIPAAVLGVI